jgi:hypothetical protein
MSFCRKRCSGRNRRYRDQGSGRIADRTAMLKGNITNVEMAERMPSSRAALNRLLDQANDAVTLLTRGYQHVGR